MNRSVQSVVDVGASEHLARHDVVFTFAHDTWQDAVVRGMERPHDRFVQHLLASPRVGGLVIADAYRTWQRFLARELARGRPDGPTRTTTDGPERVAWVRPKRVRRGESVSIPAVIRTYRRYGSALARASARSDLSDPCFVTANPFVAAFAPLEFARSVTFYARDDWASFPAHRHLWPAYRQAYQEIRSRHVRVAAVTTAVLERIAPTGPSITVPNGVAESEWVTPEPAPTWFAKLPGPRLVYAGYLDERLDVTVLGALADHVDGSIVLLGAVAPSADLGDLLARPNVHQRHLRDRRELVATVSAAEACLVPHRSSPFTAAMSPLKLYEYLAAGRPVVATDVESHRNIHPGVRLAEGPAHFMAEVDRAVAEGPTPEAERRRFLSTNSWSVRHATLLDLVVS